MGLKKVLEPICAEKITKDKKLIKVFVYKLKTLTKINEKAKICFSIFRNPERLPSSSSSSCCAGKLSEWITTGFLSSSHIIFVLTSSLIWKKVISVRLTGPFLIQQIFRYFFVSQVYLEFSHNLTKWQRWMQPFGRILLEMDHPLKLRDKQIQTSTALHKPNSLLEGDLNVRLGPRVS